MSEEKPEGLALVKEIIRAIVTGKYIRVYFMILALVYGYIYMCDRYVNWLDAVLGSGVLMFFFAVFKMYAEE